MLLFHLPPRKINFIDDVSALEGPLTVHVTVSLDPPELFGEAEFTDSLRVFPTKNGGPQTIRFSGDFFRGMGRASLTTAQSLDKFHFNGSLAGAPISITGDSAAIGCVLPDMKNFVALVQCITQEFPACFACATDVPVSIKSIQGTVNGHSFSVVMDEIKGEHFSVSDNLHEDISVVLAEILPDVSRRPIQIVAAMRYLSQTNLLQFVSKFPYQFISERMLNLCKAVECLTLEYGDKIDDMRSMLTEWGISSKYIEIFVSIRHLRSKLDIAHIAYSPLSISSYRAIRNFLPVAEMCTRSLLITAIRQHKDNEKTYKVKELNQEEPDVIKRLADYEGIDIHAASDLRVQKSQ